MVIVRIDSGLGNQFGQYVAARLLAYKLNTEIKLDTSWCYAIMKSHCRYRLGAFNIIENFATPEEIKRVRESGLVVDFSRLPTLKNIQGDIYVYGQGPRPEKYFNEIIDIVRKEFTLKKPFNPTAEAWRQKIMSAECSVSMHFRHGDFAYNPKAITNNIKEKPWFNITPLDYYYTCLDILKERYKNLTVFVFSNNLAWVKENLKLDVPTEFVEGVETDDEEFVLIGLCKHNINPNSSFSEYAASLNANPDKKIFSAAASTAEGVKKFKESLTSDKKNFLLDNPQSWSGWIHNQPEITQRPIFSLLLVMNNDATNLSATLNSLLSQDYKYYEVVIIDNASTDGSDKICQQIIEGNTKFTYKRLVEKVNNATAWNEAFKVAQGKYVSFLKVGDRFFAKALTQLYPRFCFNEVDIIHAFSLLEENGNGTVTVAGKKCSAQRDTKFKDEKRSSIMSKDGADAAKLLLNHEINSFLGTKLYNVEFLTEHEIKFDETLDDEATEISFQKEAFLKTNYLMYISNALYVAPIVNNIILGGGISVQGSNS